MAKITATEYVKPTAAEAPNPFTDTVKEFADKGIDTAFAVTFTAAEYKAEKLLIQRAANTLGVTAREVQTTWDGEKEYKGTEDVNSVFVIRPLRKRKGEGAAAADDQE